MNLEQFDQSPIRVDDVEMDKRNVERDPQVIALINQMEHIARGNMLIERSLAQLPTTDSIAAQVRTRSRDVYLHAVDALKGAALAFTLLMTNSALAHNTNGIEKKDETGLHMELEHDNPQREAYKSANAYHAYLANQIKTYEALRALYPDVTTYAGRVVDQELQGLHDETTALVSDAKVGINRAERMSMFHDLVYRPTIDSVRQSLAEHVHSPEYEVRARVEGLSDEEIEERKKRAKQDPVYVTGPVAMNDANGDYHGQDAPEYLRDIVRVATPGADSDGVGFKQIVVHELQHYITRGNEGLSQTAKNLYKEAFDDSYYTDHQTLDGRSANEYLTDPTELDARKREFEYEFERLTDWEYGQPFTSEHVKQARQLLNEGKFHFGVEQFLNVIKSEYLERIMNTLADTGSQEGSLIDQTA